MRRTDIKSRQSGNAMVEFALGIGLLWLLFSGIFQFGYAFYLYNRLQTNVSNAAVYAMQLDYNVDNTAAFTTAVKNMVISGDPTDGTHPVVKGLDASKIKVSINPELTMPTDITITIQGLTLGTFFKSWTLTNKPRVTTLYLGVVRCSAC